MFTFDGGVTYLRRKALPPCSGVYYIIFKNRYLYIGRSKNIQRRCSNHPVFKKIEKAGYSLRSLDIFFKIDFSPIDRERIHIEIYKPEFNKF